MTEVKEKGTGKTVVIALVGLVAILCVSIAYIYTSSQSQITVLTDDKTSLQGQVNTLTTEKAALQSQLTILDSTYQNYMTLHTYTDSEYNTLNDDRDMYYDIANLNYEQTFVDRETVYHAPGYYYHWPYEIYYASYVTVTVHTSTVANTYIRVLYSAYGVDFDQTIYVGGAGTATFPLLPCDNLDVIVGNTYNAAATYTVSIVLYY